LSVFSSGKQGVINSKPELWQILDSTKQMLWFRPMGVVSPCVKMSQDWSASFGALKWIDMWR